MKTITIECTWRTIDVLEVPDDYEYDGSLDDVWADQVDPHAAHLVDWDMLR